MLINKNSQRTRKLSSYQIKIRDAFLQDQRIRYDQIDLCPLCEGTEHQAIAEIDQFSIPLLTVCCSSCGLIYSNKQLTNESTQVFYDEYYRKIYEGVEKANLNHNFYQKLYDGWVSRVPAFLKKNDLVIEFGCGGGWNLLPYKKIGIPCIGFDYDSDMIRFGTKCYGLNLNVGGIEVAIKQEIRADYVILSQFLEHLKDPVNFLVNLKKCLSNDGLVCITVPSIDYLYFFGGNSTHFSIDLNLQNAHNFLFSEQTLESILVKSGYDPILILGGYALARNSEAPTKLRKKQYKNKLKEIYRAQKFKFFLEKKLPNFIFLGVLARFFYFSRPIRTGMWIIINRFGILRK